MRWLRVFLLLVAAPAAAGVVSAAALAQNALSGFSEASSSQQLELEKLFSSLLSPESARRHHQILTQQPHVAGQEAQKNVALYVLEHLRSLGIASEIVEYHAWLPYPRAVSLELVEPEALSIANREKGYAEDPHSSWKIIPPFHAYSPSAEVEGDVVYVNYGLPEDYAGLAELGIDVTGKVVLARYGRSFRGVKVKVAEEKGAAGILIYSDPMDDGYFKGDVFPKGPWRPAGAIQRGSVQYLFVYPGDPLTPGVAAHAEAERIAPEEAENLPRIPSHPLSYEDASGILSRLQGPSVPEGWQGALPFTYHLGPGPSRVRMKLEMDYGIRVVRNVIGRIRGELYPDEWVIVGNHMDAWNFGAVDANSGTTALLEMAGGLARLLADGFHPRRSIILAAWDGEEYGLIGSTEWAEDHRSELTQKAVAYLNVDVGVSGHDFTAGAVPCLHNLVREVTRFVTDPKTGATVYQAWLERERRGKEEPPEEVSLGDLGSGSDYTVFLDHLGIPSLTLGFEGAYGVYHSLYDTHYWMSRFGDPGWEYHPAMSEILGRMVLRLANAEVLPFDYADYGRALVRHLEAQTKRSSRIEELSVDWTPLLEQALNMEKIGSEIGAGTRRLLKQPLEAAKVRRINTLFIQAERAFLSGNGLPLRPWFKHSIYAPGFYTGYASQPLPGVSEAIDRGEYTIALLQTEQLLLRLKEVNQILDQIRRLTQ